MAKITTENFRGFIRLNLENDQMKLGILPEIGAKMISLIDKSTGREYLSLSGRKFQRPIYGGDFEAYDISGFDECFPTLGQCDYPEGPWQGVVVPPHGELWSQPWNYQIEKNEVVFRVSSIRFAYEFRKSVVLNNDKVEIRYEVKNPGSHDFKYLWSAHPLFAVTPQSRIILPDIEKVYVDYSKHERLGKFLDTVSWPESVQADGAVVDLSTLESARSGRADKLFAGPLKQGWCGWCDPVTGDFVKIEFPIDKIAYVGLWINLGGFPDDTPDYNIALEPCTGYPDRLDLAIENGSCGLLKGASVNHWQMHIQIGRQHNMFGENIK